MKNSGLKLALLGSVAAAIYFWLKNKKCEDVKASGAGGTIGTGEPAPNNTGIIPPTSNTGTILGGIYSNIPYNVRKPQPKPNVSRRPKRPFGIMANEPIIDYNKLNEGRIPPVITPPLYVLDNTSTGVSSSGTGGTAFTFPTAQNSVSMNGALNTTNIQTACRCKDREHKRYKLGLIGLNL